MRNEIETKRNETIRNSLKRNETKSKRFGQFRFDLFRFGEFRFASFRILQVPLYFLLLCKCPVVSGSGFRLNLLTELKS